MITDRESFEIVSKCTTDYDPLNRLRHVQPTAGYGRVEQPDATLGTPLLHDLPTHMPLEVVPDEQHPDRRQVTI
jgi:hypothetical protein